MRVSERIDRVPWDEVRASLWSTGYARMGSLLTQAECLELRSLYEVPELFRSRIEMARFRFGRGEYQYFSYPLPEIVATMRSEIYRQLAGPASEWMAALSISAEFPPELEGFLENCHREGQNRPTPLLLRYQKGDFNCLHQDLYGSLAFPFQTIISLSRSGEEFTGGELVLVEQQPRAQSVAHAITLGQGEAVVITTRYRPAEGAKGYRRTSFRHGVSRIRSGERFTLGLIFHDAA